MMQARAFIRSLRGRLLLGGLAMALVPLTVATTLAVRSARDAMETRIGSDRAGAAAQIASSVERLILDRMIEVNGVAQNSELVGAVLGFGDEGATKSVLNGLIDSGHLARSAAVYDQSGQLMGSVARGDEPAREGSVGQEAWFADSRSDESTWVGPVTRDARGLSVRISNAVRSMTGSSLGIVTVELDWDEVIDAAFGKIEAGYRSGGARSLGVYLVGADGIVVGATDDQAVLSASIEGTGALEGIRANESGSEVEAIFDGKALAAFAPMSAGRIEGYGSFLNGDAGVLVVQDATEAFADVASLRNLLIVVALILAGLAAAAAYYAAAGIAAPVVVAAEAATRLAVGDAAFEIEELDTDDELGRMITALAHVRQYITKLTVAAEKVGSGDMTIQLEPQGEHDQLSRAFLAVASVNSDLAQELTRLSQHARSRQLRR